MVPICVLSCIWIVFQLIQSCGDNKSTIWDILVQLLFAFACLAIPILIIVAVLHAALDASSLYTVRPDGFLRQYKTGKQVFIPWSNIEDACACCTYGDGYRALVMRFCLDKKLDDRVKNEKDFWMPWPKRLGWRYMSLHPKKILTFEYSENGEREVASYYPGFYRDPSIIPWIAHGDTVDG